MIAKLALAEQLNKGTDASRSAGEAAIYGSKFDARNRLVASARSIKVPRLGSNGTSDECVAAEECPLAIVYDVRSVAILMAMPADLTDLAIGFCLAEGHLRELDELAGAFAAADVACPSGALTSRISAEMVQKSAAIGVVLHLGADREASGITLVGIARGREFEIFSHPAGTDRRFVESLVQAAVLGCKSVEPSMKATTTRRRALHAHSMR